MKIALACGGTGGHIFPGLATAEALVRRGHDVTLWLAGKDVEASAVKGWSGPVITVRSQGLPTGLGIKVISSTYSMIQASRACRAIMRKENPDVLLAMGSYASVGPVSAAMKLKIPFVLHESNAIPGRAVSLFSRWAAATGVCFDESRFYLRGRRIELTGMPLRRDLEERAMKHQWDPSRDPALSLLVMGGSRGAHALNEIVTKAVCEAHRRGHLLKVKHLAGTRDVDHVRQVYSEAGVPHEVFSFVHDMASVYETTDVAICRAGAATCAELSAFGIPSLLVPYPSAVRNHQMLNARAMEKVGAADVIPERDLNAEWLVGYLANSARSGARLQRLHDAARARATKSGADALAELVEKTGAEHYAGVV